MHLIKGINAGYVALTFSIVTSSVRALIVYQNKGSTHDLLPDPWVILLPLGSKYLAGQSNKFFISPNTYLFHRYKASIDI